MDNQVVAGKLRLTNQLLYSPFRPWTYNVQQGGVVMLAGSFPETLLLQKLLSEVKQVIRDAMTRHIPETDVAWTQMRWGIPDITASWPKQNPTRNIHAWLEGTWPSYEVRFEGAQWVDDEKGLKRRVRFFRAQGAPLHLQGAVEEQQEAVLRKAWRDGREQVIDRIAALMRDMDSAKLDNVPWDYKLMRDPRQFEV
ncbi:MAG: hypothetical protein HY686_04860 [Chloroflexi bacterium]|nr:hypothetical protein [Chloroflexota bacterium]